MANTAAVAKTSTRPTGARAFLARRSVQRYIGRTLIYLLLVAGAVVLMMPLAWLLSSSLKPSGLIFVVPPQWIPDPIAWQNYAQVWEMIPFGLYLRNTLVITVFCIIGASASAAIVAFGFARLRFPGRDVLFLVLLSTIMIPEQVTLIPTYVLFRILGWLDSYYPLIVPAFFGGGAFNIFLLRQYYMRLPLELDDAARIDGCSSFGIFRRILLPQCRPALGVIAILLFMGNWNGFFLPLIYLNSPDKYTLALGLNLFRGTQYTAWNLLMAASTMVSLPCIVLYFVAQRYFIQGIVFTGIKG
ncbi:MAG: carbohydrate ABC transporter permease [Anaerolineae bacterium]|nr:carbohydrate ABC transporter permease [Anaerolineae bacterium]